MDKFILVLFSILLCVLAMVYFKNLCQAAILLTSALLSIQTPIQTPIQTLQQITYGGACHSVHKYSQDIVVDGLNVYNCLRDFLTAQGINKNPLKTTNPHALYYALIKSMLIATTGTIHLVAKDDTVVYDVMMDILYKNSSLADKNVSLNIKKIPEYLLHRIKFYYATYTQEGRSSLQKAKAELAIATTGITNIKQPYKNDYIAIDEISKKMKHSRYNNDQKKCFNEQLIAIRTRKDKMYSINEKIPVNKALDNFIDKSEKEHALRGIDDNLALYTLSNLIKVHPNVYYVSNDMLSEMPRKLHPSNYMYKVFTNSNYDDPYTTMDVEKNLQAVTTVVDRTEILSKCMFTIDDKSPDICFILYKPGGKDGKTIIHVTQTAVQLELSSEVSEVCEELATLYIMLQLYLNTKSDSEIEDILQCIDTDGICAEYGQKVTSYNSIQELIIESKENSVSVSDFKTILNKAMTTDLYNNQGISYLRTDVTFDEKILLAIKYLRSTNDLQSYESAKYIDRINYISNKPVEKSISIKLPIIPEPVMSLPEPAEPEPAEPAEPAEPVPEPEPEPEQANKSLSINATPFQPIHYPIQHDIYAANQLPMQYPPIHYPPMHYPPMHYPPIHPQYGQYPPMHPQYGQYPPMHPQYPMYPQPQYIPPQYPMQQQFRQY